MKPMFFSLKPQYANLIFNGAKQVELRKRIAPGMEGRTVIAYASSPVRELLGSFRIARIWEGHPSHIWMHVATLCGVTESDFNAYYEGRSMAYGLEIEDVRKFDTPIGLEALRASLPNFVVPQSWRYIKPEEYEFLLANNAIAPSRTQMQKRSRQSVIPMAEPSTSRAPCLA